MPLLPGPAIVQTPAVSAGVVGFGQTALTAYTFGDMWVPHAATTTLPFSTFGADIDHGQPFFLLSPITINQLNIKVSTLIAASNVRVALYNADSTWYPTSLVVDGGNLDTSSTGVKTASIASTQLSAGRYILAAAPDANAATGVILTAYSGPDPFGPNLPSNNFITEIFNSRSFAAFPSTYPVGAWSTATANTGFKYFVFPNVVSSP